MATARTLLPPVYTRAADLSDAVYTASARCLLTHDAQDVLNGLLLLLAQHTDRERVPINHVEVAAIDASEELGARIVVTLWVALSADATLALWDRLGDAVEQWAATLPVPQALIVMDFLALDIQWSTDAGAV